MTKAVIFDLNGVFLQSEFLSDRFHRQYPNVSTEEFLVALKEVMAVVRCPGIVSAFKLWEPHLQKWGILMSENDFWTFWFSGEHLVPELLNYVHKLRQKGTKVFILSNNFRERTEYYRRNFPEIFTSIDSAYFSWETGFVKPDPKALLNVLEKNNLKPEETIFFDDQDKNIEAASALGIEAVKFQTLSQLEEDIKSLLSKV